MAHISRDELNGRLHFRNHTLSFRDPIQARLAEVFLLGNGADRVDVRLDITGDKLAVATHAALQIHKVVGTADATDARLDLFTVLSEALVLTTGRFERLLGVLQAHGFLGRVAWPAL